MHIRAMTPTDAPDVLKIYQDGIDTGNATFETTAPTWETFDHTHLPDHRLIAHDDTGPLGWIAATPTSTRHVYRGVIEHSIYIATHAQGRGVGSALLAAFVDSCETAGIWTIQAGIFPDNTPSLALHENTASASSASATTSDKPSTAAGATSPSWNAAPPPSASRTTPASPTPNPATTVYAPHPTRNPSNHHHYPPPGDTAR